MIHFKYFTTAYKDPINQIKELRKAFPNMYFFKGRYKDLEGVYCASSPDNKEYGEVVELNNNTTQFFWGPKDIQTALNSLKEYQTGSLLKIPVKALETTELLITPATAIPKKVVFGNRKSTDTKEVKYAQLAFEVFSKIENKEQILLHDENIIELVKEALKASYKLPIDVFDSLAIIDEEVLERIVLAALGIDDDTLKKTLEEYN
jgi:hypothetical protein